MANILKIEKKVAVVSALTEGASIRAIERMTGVHRDTIMRLGVRVGNACTGFMDQTMRNLPCQRVQLDEIWGFIGKKQKRLRAGDSWEKGDVYTFIALDADTKVVPCFKVGKRTSETARAFVEDLSSRLENRIQLSSDAFTAYAEAVEDGFGIEVDYGQIVKTYAAPEAERRYSPAEIVSVEKATIIGYPDPRHISTSFIESQNLTIRYLRSERVCETFQGRPVWDGAVMVFEASDAGTPILCYGWGYRDRTGRHLVAVVGKPPIHSAVDAVRAYVAKEIREATGADRA